jgi:hypothetical protein
MMLAMLQLVLRKTLTGGCRRGRKTHFPHISLTISPNSPAAA